MPSYVLLWNPKEWPHSNILRMLSDLEKSGVAKEPWRFMSRKSGKPGDDVFLLKTGMPPRGIFGHGRLVGKPFEDLGSDGKRHWMFEVHFDQLVDPLIEFLVPETALNQMSGWSVQRGSGNAPLDQTISEKLLSNLGSSGDRLTKAAEEEFQKRAKTLSETERTQITLQRIGQEVFKKSLMTFWHGKCCISGLSQAELLRASHAKDWSKCSDGSERLDVYNGLLLAAHLDAAFDAGLIGINENGVVQVSQRLNANTLRELGLVNPAKITGIQPGHRPYLSWHMKNKFQRA